MHVPAPPRPFGTLALAAALLVCGASPARAQQDTARILLRPTFALGTGMFAFYGDIGSKHKGYSPLVTRVGFEVRATTPVTDWLEVGLFAVHGRLGANERSLTRNLNFESRITTGGLLFTYNFNQLLKPGHLVEPFVTVGFESVEFLSKTDLFDAQGRRYNYWSDGTIRDLPENAPNAADAVEIQRDYTYESDIRESNLDGFGKYTERTWAIPVGVGVKMCLGNGFDARFATTMHFTRTDLLDGVTDASVGARKGDGSNDRFLFSSFSIGYAFDINKEKKKRFKPTLTPEQMDAIAMNEDEDGDGVMDWSDKCPHTPAGVPVDANGCPLDDDGDGVPNYRDDEANTPPGTPVDERGVSLSDADQLRAWLNYKDSANVTLVSSRVESFGPVGKPKTTRPSDASKRTYMVQVGSQMEGISDEMIQKILSLPDVRTIERNDTTYYVVGNYDELPEALRRELSLKGQGFNGKVMMEQDGRIVEAPDGKQRSAEGTHSGIPELDPNDTRTVIRVQLGAFRHKLAENIFHGIPDVVTVKGSDGLTRYYAGAFTDVNEAARYKVEMLLKGFNGAFLTAFKGGKRVSLKEAGAQLSVPEDLKSLPAGSIRKDAIVFRVQVGTFAGNVPMETMGKYVELGNVTPVTGANDVRYFYGTYPTRAAAEVARKELQGLGFPDAFVVGDVNGRIILAEDAEYLLNEP